MESEPAAIVGAVVGLVNAVLALLLAFGVHLSTDQTAAILGVVNAVTIVAGFFLVRSKVYAPDTVRKLVTNAHG